jgi:hypothetical protein
MFVGGPVFSRKAGDRSQRETRPPRALERGHLQWQAFADSPTTASCQLEEGPRTMTAIRVRFEGRGWAWVSAVLVEWALLAAHTTAMLQGYQFKVASPSRAFSCSRRSDWGFTSNFSTAVFSASSIAATASPVNTPLFPSRILHVFHPRVASARSKHRMNIDRLCDLCYFARPV